MATAKSKARTGTKQAKKTAVSALPETVQLSVLVEGVLQEYLVNLQKMRTDKEADIVQLSQQEGSVSRSDYDPEQFQQEKARISSLRNVSFQCLRQINIRIEEVKRGKFTDKCCSCGKTIEKEVLLNDPRRSLCISCQKQENGKIRK